MSRARRPRCAPRRRRDPRRRGPRACAATLRAALVIAAPFAVLRTVCTALLQLAACPIRPARCTLQVANLVARRRGCSAPCWPVCSRRCSPASCSGTRAHRPPGAGPGRAALAVAGRPRRRRRASARPRASPRSSSAACGCGACGRSRRRRSSSSGRAPSARWAARSGSCRATFWRTWGIRALGWVLTSVLGVLPHAAVRGAGRRGQRLQPVRARPARRRRTRRCSSGSPRSARSSRALFVGPITAAIDVLLYVDLRMRREGWTSCSRCRPTRSPPPPAAGGHRVVTRWLLAAPHPVGGAAAQRGRPRRARRTRVPPRRTRPAQPRSCTGSAASSTGCSAAPAASHACCCSRSSRSPSRLVFAVRAGVPGRRVRRAGRRRARPARAGRRPATTAGSPASSPPDGRRAEALREWLRAAVQTIEDRGVLPPRPGRTGAGDRPRGRVRCCPAAAADAGRRDHARFDEVWFGGRPATDADVAPRRGGRRRRRTPPGSAAASRPPSASPCRSDDHRGRRRRNCVRPFWRRAWLWLARGRRRGARGGRWSAPSASRRPPRSIPARPHQTAAGRSSASSTEYGDDGVARRRSLTDALRRGRRGRDRAGRLLRRPAAPAGDARPSGVVLVRPGVRASRAAVRGLSPEPATGCRQRRPICTVPAAQAAGPVDAPGRRAWATSAT